MSFDCILSFYFILDNLFCCFWFYSVNMVLDLEVFFDLFNFIGIYILWFFEVLGRKRVGWWGLFEFWFFCLEGMIIWSVGIGKRLLKEVMFLFNFVFVKFFYVFFLFVYLECNC